MIKDTLIKIIKKIGAVNLPMTHKKFSADEYLEVSNLVVIELAGKPCFLLVTTYGAISNYLIRFSYLFGKNKNKRSKTTHAVASLGDGRVVEALSTGVVTRGLFHSLWGRDEVKILTFSRRVSEELQKLTLENIRAISKQEIDYDHSHDVNDDTLYDCSELIFDAVNDAYEMMGHERPLKPVKRFGQPTYSPIDIENSGYFQIVYSNKKD